VRYTYDGKRRVTAVSLNGVDEYVKYEYKKEDVNDDEKIEEIVKATLKNGIETTVIKNAFYGAIRDEWCVQGVDAVSL